MVSDLITYKEFGNFKVRKYKREVFFNNLWHTDPLLLESRGHVLDENDNIVALPFKKIFNYQENGTSVHKDKIVVAVEKVNGFMFHVTQHEDFIIEGTTGSLDSPFVTLAKENMKKHGVNYKAFKELLETYNEPVTCIFEIKDNKKDPHIIDDEEDGVYLLGIRLLSDGRLVQQMNLDSWAKKMNVKRPKWIIKSFSEVLEETSKVKHEGFVVYCPHTQDALLKLKSPYYISKKTLMRKKAENVYKTDYKHLVDEEYYPIIEKIREMKTVNEWSVMSEQDRGYLFNLIYRSSLMTVDQMIKFITNHPKISYNLEDDSIKIAYDYYSDYYVSRVDSFKINKPEIGLVKNGEYRGAGDTVIESIRNLYLDVFSNLGDYVYDDDLSLHKKAQIQYYDDIKKYTELETENLYQDIVYYCRD